MRLVHTRLVASAAAALLLGAALTGCGSDSKDKDSADSPKASVLGEAEATTALLTEGNLNGKFTASADESDDDDAPGCMQGVTEVLGDDDDAENTAERDFTSADTSVGIFVSSKVLSYKSEDEAEKAIGDVQKALEACTAVTETDSEGFSYDLKVDSDDEKSADSADDQVNALASGPVTAKDATGQSNVSLYLSLVRVGNNITAVTASTFDSELPGPITDLVEVVVDRLAAVVDGKTPDESVVAGA
jgi:hypothetical protein